MPKTNETFWVAMVMRRSLTVYGNIPAAFPDGVCGVMFVYPTRELAEAHNPGHNVLKITSIQPPEVPTCESTPASTSENNVSSTGSDESRG